MNGWAPVLTIVLLVLGAPLDANFGTSIAVIDDVLFLSGVCLAAGALLVGHTGPVWERADEYLDRVQSMGVLIAEAVSDGS